VTAVSTDDHHRYDRRQRADLAITPLHVQLLILYHLVTAKAAIAVGGVGTRADADGAAVEETAAVKS
jgi:hypothetical protein